MKSSPRIDDLIIDEAAAATEPELYIPFHLQPNRLLVVGDPKQLPATVTSRRATEFGLAKSLHERLMYDLKCAHVMLNVQYRMRPEISAFPNERFYENMVGNGSNVTNPEYGKNALLLNRQPYVVLQLEGQEKRVFGGSYENRIEAKIIAKLVFQLRQIAEKSQSGNEWYGPDRIRVITFYEAQVACIESCLAELGLADSVVVATVDSSQGCEADIVLVSFVRSPGDVDGPSAGFLKDDRRMNVALTRAKYQLICVGNVRSFRRMPNAPTIHQFAENAEERGVILTLPHSGHSSRPTKSISVEENHR